MPEEPAMSNSNSAPSSTFSSYLEQTASMLSSAASYMRLPALASTVCSPPRCSGVNMRDMHEFYVAFRKVANTSNSDTGHRGSSHIATVLQAKVRIDDPCDPYLPSLRSR